MSQTRKAVIWIALFAAIAIPVAAAAMSPQLAWRGPAYITAGFAGVLAMTLLLVQPLLAGGYLPGLSPRRRRQAHLVFGILLVIAVVVHVVGLWITSPPDALDALLFRSPTPFSIWGVLAMWAVFAAALLALLRRLLRLRLHVWRMTHLTFAAFTIMGSVVHAMMIEGTMETVSKAVLCIFVVAVTSKLMIDLRFWNTQDDK